MLILRKFKYVKFNLNRRLFSSRTRVGCSSIFNFHTKDSNKSFYRNKIGPSQYWKFFLLLNRMKEVELEVSSRTDHWNFITADKNTNLWLANPSLFDIGFGAQSPVIAILFIQYSNNIPYISIKTWSRLKVLLLLGSGSGHPSVRSKIINWSLMLRRGKINCVLWRSRKLKEKGKSSHFSFNLVNRFLSFLSFPFCPHCSVSVGLKLPKIYFISFLLISQISARLKFFFSVHLLILMVRMCRNAWVLSMRLRQDNIKS